MERDQEWRGIANQNAHRYRCGHSDCNRDVSSEKGWSHPNNQGNSNDGWVYVCPQCRRPTFFDIPFDKQIPGVPIGASVDYLPENVKSLWDEMRQATSHNAFTSAVLTGRKLLMHIAVEQGAKTGLSFVDYVDHLTANHFAPPNSKDWVDRIRTHGNEANHEIIIKTKADAEEIMVFLEMLLKFIYEFPQRGAPKQPAA